MKEVSPAFISQRTRRKDVLRITTLWKMLALGKSSSTSSSPSRGAKEEDTVQANRRRLIKGAASAPMILTLYNGAALARSSIMVTEALTYDDLFDAEKGIDRPICVTAERLDPVGTDGRNFHVINGEANFMDCVKETNDGFCKAPNNEQQMQDYFNTYNNICETDNGGLLIVASSSASLIH